MSDAIDQAIEEFADEPLCSMLQVHRFWTHWAMSDLYPLESEMTKFLFREMIRELETDELEIARQIAILGEYEKVMSTPEAESLES